MVEPQVDVGNQVKSWCRKIPLSQKRCVREVNHAGEEQHARQCRLATEICHQAHNDKTKYTKTKTNYWFVCHT